MLERMRRLVIAILVPLFPLLPPSSASAATPCGDKVPEQGLCVSPMQVVWCESGEVKTLECKKGTVCAWNDQSDAFDCVPDACKDVPPEGRCKSADVVEWCETGLPKTLKCAEGTVCGRMGELFDCLKASQADEAAAAPDVPDAGPAVEPKDASPTAADATSGTDSAPLLPPPSFEVKDSADAGAYGRLSADTGGCAAGPGPVGGAWIVAMILCALVAVRRLCAY